MDPAVARRHHCPVEFDIAYLDCNRCTFRRVTLVKIYHHESGHVSGSSLFAWDMVRRPVGYSDLDT